MTSRVFVGNLNYETTEQELREALSGAGTIVDVHTPVDRETGRPRGFAFVEFSTDEEATAAIEQFDGYELAGRTLRVNEAEERRRGGGRPDRPDKGGGGGRNEDRPPRGKPNGKPKGSRRGMRAKKRSL